jgi:hypothetical protein
MEGSGLSAVPTEFCVSTIFAGIAEFERALIISRTSDGRVAANARGAALGWGIGRLSHRRVGVRPRRCYFGFHSRAGRCASAIRSEVIRDAEMSRFFLPISLPPAAPRFDHM